MTTCFLPVRSGSERVKNKSVKYFQGYKGGLLELKLNQLLLVKGIDEIILSTNCQTAIDIAQRISKEIRIDFRPQNLCASTTKLRDLVSYVPSVIKEGDILWTHVTSPFFDELSYENAICKFENVKDLGYDSLMAVKRIKSFLLDADNKGVNFGLSKGNWPRTQDLDAYYEITSATFLAPIDCYKNYNNRIGITPFKLETTFLESLDIDEPSDWQLANHLYSFYVQSR